MKLTNQDLDILRELIRDKLSQLDRGPEAELSEEAWIYINILKKLDSMYFS